MRPPEFSSTTYCAVWYTCQAIFDLLYKTEIIGLRNVPKEGPFLLAANHASFLDPPIIGSNLTRELAYFARKTLFNGAFGKLIRDLNSIPIDRDRDSDLKAFRQVFSVIKSGGCLLVFPEGTRSHDGSLGSAKSGVGMIACRAQVPVLPVRLHGSFDIWNRNRKLPSVNGTLTMVIGKCLKTSEYDPGKADSQRYMNASKAIMSSIDSLELPFCKAI